MRKKKTVKKIRRRLIQNIKRKAHSNNLSNKDDLSLKKDLDSVKDLISSLAIEFWRLEKRIKEIKLVENKIKELVDLSDLIDQAQRMSDVLTQYNIEICNHNNEPYSDGKRLKVLHVEEVEGMVDGRMKVIETIKPTVYFKGESIFNGEVIVGKSKTKEEKIENE